MERITDINTLMLYRQRVIPSECILLKKDNIISYDADHLITSWNTLNPKKEFDHGCSLYDFVHGLKISKFYTSSGDLLYWYCDIVSYKYEKDTNSLYVKDLLADVIIYPDGHFNVVDLDELSLAYKEDMITKDEMTTCLSQLSFLLDTIQFGDFSALQDVLTRAEESL